MLIDLCHEANKNGERAYMVCSSHAEAERVANLADELGKPISFRVITFGEFVNRRFAGQHITQFYIDNIEMLLQYISSVPIAAISINKDESDEDESL